VALSHDHDCVRTGWWAGGYVDERVGDFVAGGWCAGRKRRSAADGLFVGGLGRLQFPAGRMPGARRLKQADALLCVSHPQ
jgi:hypothetical protein